MEWMVLGWVEDRVRCGVVKGEVAWMQKFSLLCRSW
jgi:hypothetical protein